MTGVKRSDQKHLHHQYYLLVVQNNVWEPDESGGDTELVDAFVLRRVP